MQIEGAFIQDLLIMRGRLFFGFQFWNLKGLVL